MNVNDIKGFHIELTNMCTLKCPGCARTQFIEQWPQHWRNHNITAEDLFNFLDIDLYNLSINLCGTYGDPIYHPEFLDLVEEFINKGANLFITTNGSYKSRNWWQNLTKILTEKDTITFSVDGTPTNFSKYRINGDWQSIEVAMSVVSESTVNSVWKYIVFNYNENTISEAKTISESIGVKNFKLQYSDRFDNKTHYLKPNSSDMIGEKIFKRHASSDSAKNISPRCMNNLEHYISADGFYTPCCDTADHRFYYKNEFGKNKNEYDIKDCTVTQILNRPKVLQFYNELELQPVCQFNCPGSN